MRVDLSFGIGYRDSIEQAKRILYDLMEQHEKGAGLSRTFLGVIELGDSSVNFAVWTYDKPQDYWAIYFDLYKQEKNALDKEGIEIPFPQRVVHQA